MRARDALSIAALVVLVLLVCADLARGVPPTTHDHSFHLYKVVETEQLLRRGRFVGWTDLEYAGYPHNAVYPMIAPLLTAAIHALPLVSLERAYAWTILLVVLGDVLAVWWAARVHFDRATALLAAVFALCDPGAFWLGGNACVLDIGIWPSQPAASCALVCLALLPRSLASASWRDAIAPGLVLGVGISFHPLAALLVGAAALPMAIAVLGTSPAPPIARVLRSGAISAAIAFGACAFWLVPFALAGPFVWDFRMPPLGAAELWSHFVDGSILASPALWWGATLCGLVMLARRDAPFARFVALFVPAAIVLSSRDALAWLHLAGPVVDRLQVRRVFFLARALCAIAAAFAITQAARRARSRGAVRGWRAHLATGFAAAVLVVFLAAFPWSIPGAPRPSSPQDLTREERADEERALDRAADAMRPGERLAIFDPVFGRHGASFAAAVRGTKTLTMGSNGAVMFATCFPVTKPEAYWGPNLALASRIGVTAILFRGGVPPSFASLPSLGTFGAFDLRAAPRLARAWIDGDGADRAQVDVAEWTDETIAIDVRGAAPGSRLALGLGWYDAWRDDAGRPPDPYVAAGEKLASWPARDGRVVLRYVKPAREWIGLAITCTSAIALAFALRRARRVRRHGAST